MIRRTTPPAYSPVGVDDGEGNAISDAEGDPPDLTIILARVDAFESRAEEADRGNGEIEAPLREVAVALLRISVEAHARNILVYIRSCNGPYGRITPELPCERVQHNASAASFHRSLDKFSVR